ncbi:hypothetical protein [Pseudoalteromonas xiamenensis]|uniref:Uncharacterized protein n=1 Tax=Pseudoalteromonas xiamenensis TaxID=882626 RepID=A0A975HMC4_9GAMM|nr:hypothetical protein [Pseudoalteromonas xiamenensis]QTH73001.1 hypothetical protein J5O05_17230 [Pseudoalteromonas xiamenensis]
MSWHILFMNDSTFLLLGLIGNLPLYLLKRFKELEMCLSLIEFAREKCNQNIRSDELSQLGLQNCRFDSMERKRIQNTTQDKISENNSETFNLKPHIHHRMVRIVTI